MELKSSLIREQNAVLTKSAIWKHKNASDTSQISRRLKEQLASDILCLYENSQFVDLKLECSEGFIYSHQIIVAGRFPSGWSLLLEISQIQILKLNRKANSLGLLTVSLPRINFQDLRSFIRSLYTNQIDEIAGITFQIHLEEHLITLKQSLFDNQKLFLEKLNFEEEQEIQRRLLSQLRKGEISEAKGNLRDVTHLVPKKKLKCPSNCGKRSSGYLERAKTFRRSDINDGMLNHRSHSSRIPVSKQSSVVSQRKQICYPYDRYSEYAMNSKGLFKKVIETSDTNNINKDHKEETLKSVSCLENYSSSKNTSSEDEAVTQVFKKCTSYAGKESYSDNGNELITPEGSGTGVKAKIKKKDGLKKKMPSTESILCNNNKPGFHSSSSEKASFESEESKPYNLFPSRSDDKMALNIQSLHDEDYPISDSDPNGLHETSSLEVELPSSHEDQSLSPDSVKSDATSNSDKVNNENELNSFKDSSNKAEDFDLNNHKPLVRTRTFDLIEPTCAALYLQEDNNNEDDTEDGGDLTSSNAKSTCSDHEELTIVNLDVKPVDDPEKLREIERKKGSLLFEHNIQTFSNIPSTNMMNVSMSSDGSIGLASLYSSMMDSTMFNSLHSIASSENKLIDPSFISTSLHDVKLPHTITPLNLSAFEDHIKKSNPLSDTQSPSPDSLCIDHSSPYSKNEPNSLSKEDFDFEEKEKDEKEVTSKSSYNPSQENIDYAYNLQEEKVATVVEANDSANPRTGCKDDNKPIVSGGSTLKLESLKSCKEDNHPKLTQRQFSIGSVKNIDAIPVVCGYISPEMKTEEETDSTKNDQQDEQQNQSMFSMFINFNEIPSPEKAPPPLPPKTKSHPTGGMYMFIEADNVPSPKMKRKNKPEIDNSKITKSSNKPETILSFKPDHILHNSPVPACKIKASNADEDKTSKAKDEKVKKGFFVFIEAESCSKSPSSKSKRRPPIQRKVTKREPNVMSKSAPSDCLFTQDDSAKSSTTESSNKLMTKSVIDREEFMAQPATRRNVSLNDKINESSKIPRPVPNFKEKLSLERPKRSSGNRNEKMSDNKNKMSEFNGIKSLEGSMSEAATSMSMSFSEMASSLPPDVEDVSEFSDVSSLLSSMDRSNGLSSDHKDTLNSLGDDLLKMFLNEINTDVVIQIGEKKIKAHKCILASRCVYFAAMLSGHWVESAGNVIKLQGFSPEAVTVALKHIYSGSSTVPEGVKVGELAALADMLALDGLKDVVAQNLKANLCHYFHKPCPDCINGVLEVLPIAGAFCLEELYHKCLRWIAKHFSIVMPTRNFASLPSELQDRCLKQIVDDMSISNVIDTALGGERILTILPVVRWAQPIFDLTAQLLESATNFIATNLSGVLSSERFLELGRDEGWSDDSLEDTLKLACELVRPDQAVLAHIQLTNLAETGQDDCGNKFSEHFIGMVERLLKQIEKFIIHNANRVAVCRKWPLLPAETQKRIKDAALVVIEFSKPLAPRPKFTSASRVRSRGNSTEPVQRLRTSSMTDHRLSRSASANVVPPRQALSSSTKKLQAPNGRCHTPPPSVIRASLQTPPPTRASTLRAQARQAAIQRSQSARTVVETPKKLKSLVPDLSTNDDTVSNSNCNKSSNFTRSRTSSQGSFNTFSSASRSSTPGLSDRMKHKRNASGPQLTLNKIVTKEGDEVFHRIPVADQNLGGGAFASNFGNPRFLRAQSVDAQKNPRSFSIGASPIHHLGSVREVPPKDPKKQIISGRSKLRPSMGRRVRSPLRDNHRGSPSVALPHGPPNEGQSAPVRNDGNAIVVGLGSRSNTFCKEEGPSTRTDLVKE